MFSIPFRSAFVIWILEEKAFLRGQSRQTADEGVEEVLIVWEVELHRLPH